MMHYSKNSKSLRQAVGFLLTSAFASSLQGSIFSGSVLPPPDNYSESFELVLLIVTVQGPTEMNVRESYDFYLEGGFYNTGTGLLEEYTLTTVEWDVSASPSTALSIEEDGTFEATAYPSIEFPRAVTIEASTTEATPLDSEGQPFRYDDTQALSITEPASFTTYSEWVSAEGLNGVHALETADPDKDGILNITEFAMGFDPETPNTMDKISQSIDLDTGLFTFSFTTPKSISEISMFIETTTDLSADPAVWTSRTMTLESSTDDTETWKATATLGDEGFGRLRVETY